jgi:hypothetical protein
MARCRATLYLRISEHDPSLRILRMWFSSAPPSGRVVDQIVTPRLIAKTRRQLLAPSRRPDFHPDENMDRRGALLGSSPGSVECKGIRLDHGLVSLRSSIAIASHPRRAISTGNLDFRSLTVGIWRFSAQPDGLGSRLSRSATRAKMTIRISQRVTSCFSGVFTPDTRHATFGWLRGHHVLCGGVILIRVFQIYSVRVRRLASKVCIRLAGHPDDIHT